MANTYFKFKQFTVNQDKCAMKVCTDACLFGATLPPNPLKGEFTVLDVGTGTGLLSLMLAQKNATAIIDAIEIETEAATQAKENVAASPWANQIHVFNEDILKFNQGKKYNYILSNPPFFEDDLQSPDEAKNNAKHNHSLNLLQLLHVIESHLAPTGFFAVLLPYHRVDYFIENANRSGFYLTRKILVKQSPRHHFFRGILFFETKAKETEYAEIIIKDAEHNYTPEFIELLKDYYLFL
jgi:tRNA1Val (adenine37-N6)-methyltransferase